MRLHVVRWVWATGISGALAIGWPVAAKPGEPGPQTARVFSSAQSTDVALTIYTAFTEGRQRFGGPQRQDVHFALVKDRRRLRVSPGVNWIRLADVAAGIEPSSVLFQSLTDPQGLQVLEQTFRYDLISPESVLRHAVGKRARFRQALPGGRAVGFSGTLLSPQGDVVRTSRGVVLAPQGSIALDGLPEGLIRRPELLWKLRARHGGTHVGEIAYFARGVSWRADYRALLAPDGESLALQGWVTVENRSGASYPNAALQLVAGDVHRAAEPEELFERKLGGAFGGAMPAAAARPQFVEESFFEYHLYTLQRRTDIPDQETKQIQFLAAPRVRARKVYLFDAFAPDRPGVATPLPPWHHLLQFTPGGAPVTQKVRVAVEARNAEAEGLGMPLPRGKVALYRADRSGREHFIGEDQIDHTPTDEKLRLIVGNAFDLTGTRRVLSVREGPQARITVEVALRNASAHAVQVEVYEHLPTGGQVVRSTLPHDEPDAFTTHFQVAVPAGGEAKVVFDVAWPSE